MKDMEINFSLTDSGGETFEFTSLRSLSDFCARERDFWAEKLEILSEESIYDGDIPPEFKVAEELKRLVDKIDLADHEDEEYPSRAIQNDLENLYNYQLTNLRSDWLYSGHPYTEQFIDLTTRYSPAAARAFLFFIQRRHSWTSHELSIDEFKGYSAAYEFENQDSDLVKRRKSERAAIGKIRKDFTESKDKLFGEVAALKSDYENLSAEAKQELVEELEAWHQQRAENDEKFDQAIMQYQWSVADSIKDHNAEIEAIKEDSRKKIRALEETYEERLRLEPAAKYWKDSAGRLRRQGVFFVALIASTVGAGLLAGIDLFETWLSHEKLPIDLTSLQGVVITITVLAIYAYILRLLSRMTFSSFHLMRDAEEREQLTYLYLALSNQTDVDEKSREIVLQALFSRSETGLLTNEHGPVMPGMDLNQLLKGIGR